MKLRLLFTLAVASLAVPSIAAAQAPSTQQDWSRSVEVTADGGFRIGNPNASVKLVEYASLTCPHCADFANQGMGPLVAKYIRSGRVSFEFRNYILNGIDVAASLLARCAEPAAFFPLADRIFATQETWFGRLQSLSQAEKDRIVTLPREQVFAEVARASGLLELAAQNGVTAERARQCMADPAALGRLERMAQAAQALGVDGTPTFFLNGRKLEVNSWPEIEPLLDG